jgi:hypothetical protein
MLKDVDRFNILPFLLEAYTGLGEKKDRESVEGSLGLMQMLSSVYLPIWHLKRD